MSRLRLRTLTACEKTIVSTRGDVDLNTARLLEARLMALVEQGCRRVVVNLAHTGYVDSAGLAVLMRAHKMLRAVGGRFTVVGCQAPVSRVLHLVGFHHLFPIEERLPARARRERAAPPALTPTSA